MAGFPDAILIELPTHVAEELLALLNNEPVSVELAAWLSFVRGDVAQARRQGGLFKDDAL